MSDFDKLRIEMKKIDYPPNHTFDPETLQPTGLSVKRVETTKLYAGELFKKHHSLLDVGCNKGMMSFCLRNIYDEITAIDPIDACIRYAIDVADSHNISNIGFSCSTFENVSEKLYDVVYFGQCTHYMFRDAVRTKKPNILDFMYKAKHMASKFMVIDGAFSTRDPSVGYDNTHDGWDDVIRATCSIESYSLALKPELELIRFIESGTSDTRHLAVFKKGGPNET